MASWAARIDFTGAESLVVFMARAKTLTPSRLSIWKLAGNGLGALIALSILGACGTNPRAPLSAGDASYQSTLFRASHPPYGDLSLTSFRDRRPSFEIGRINYLNESWYSESLLRGSVASNFKRVVLGEFAQAGVFRSNAGGQEASHELEITLYHFYAKSDRDLLGLIPIIPSIEVLAEIEFHVLLRDAEGRRFLDRRFSGLRQADTATIAGVESVAADLLLSLLSELMDEFVREADRKVREFWAQFGMQPPSAGRPHSAL